MEDLQIVETVVRKDPKVIEQCVISGIPAEDMHKVYCDRGSPIQTLRDELSLIITQPGQLDMTNASEAEFVSNKP